MATQAGSWQRWLTWFGLAVVFSIACGFLANWQLSRRAEVVAVIQRIDANFYAAPVSLTRVVPRVSASPVQNEYRPVSIRGHYLNTPMLVRNRPYNGQPGFEQLVPFETIDGLVVLVNRGWLATGNRQDNPDVVPLPSFEQQTVVARVRLGEPDLHRGRPPKWQLASIDLHDARRQLGLPNNHFYTGVYLALDSESIVQKVMPTSIAKPEITEGNHLSYAFQWVIFAVMAFVALGWAIRQEQQFRRQQSDPTFVPKRRKKLGDDDNAAEDSALA